MSTTEEETTTDAFEAMATDRTVIEQAAQRDARALRKELFSDELIDQLLERVNQDGLALTGRGGLLPELLKAVLERGMDAERRITWATSGATGPGTGPGTHATGLIEVDRAGRSSWLTLVGVDECRPTVSVVSG